MATESKVTKTTLVKMLIEKGFSVRKARKGVNAVFAAMAKQLGYGEIVPLPGGVVTVVSRKPRREFHRFRDIHTKKMQYRFVRYNKNKRGIKFTPTLELEFEPGKDKRARLAPRPEPPTLKEIRQLAAELLGRSVTDHELASLQQVINQRGPRPDSLLNRLREVKTRVVPPLNVWDLRQWMADLWWI